MNKTIVAFVGKQVVAVVPEEKEQLLVRCRPEFKTSRVIETDERYVIVRGSDERIYVALDNRSEAEDLIVKLTLTGLACHEPFDLCLNGACLPEKRVANMAGILECLVTIPAGQFMVMASC